MSAEPRFEATIPPPLSEEDSERQVVLERQRLFSAAAMFTELGYLDPNILYMPPGKPIDTNSFAFAQATAAYIAGEDAWNSYLVNGVIYRPIRPI